MRPGDIEELLSSRTRLRIADLVARRPRSLPELADLTGITVQGVIRHLRVLEGLGLVSKTKVEGREMRVRKVYSPGTTKVFDFSEADLIVVRIVEGNPSGISPSQSPIDLEATAEEVTVLRARVKDQIRKLGRAIDDLVGEQEVLREGVERVSSSTTQKLILGTIFDDEPVETSERTLNRHFGLRGGRRSIDKALAKAKRDGKR
ncbi:MAG TPA: helix-turn-helix domain-containing protein [Nitrososphaerales archaeon]|nr:helix-turn-helix domain-containing protein [Nitrososphaerales archaeon]